MHKLKHMPKLLLCPLIKRLCGAGFVEFSCEIFYARLSVHQEFISIYTLRFLFLSFSVYLLCRFFWMHILADHSSLEKLSSQPLHNMHFDISRPKRSYEPNLQAQVLKRPNYSCSHISNIKQTTSFTPNAKNCKFILFLTNYIPANLRLASNL